MAQLRIYVPLALAYALLLIGLPLQAEVHKIPYYGKSFYEAFSDGPSLLKVSFQDPNDLKDHLHRILTSYHEERPNDFDRIVEYCDEAQLPTCYRHRYFTYKEARMFLFGHLHLKNNEGAYWVQGVYCQIPHYDWDFPRGRPPAPGQIPDWRIINAEHTWPQSRFSGHFPAALQKSDLHGLFPSEASTNSSRSNLPFGDVQTVTHETCDGTRKGLTGDGSQDVFFEPPENHKGNVARALFYFSVRYRMKIDARQEAFLRRWHKLDPPDSSETIRNEEIFALQKVRNPFVDHPSLVDRITDF